MASQRSKISVVPAALFLLRLGLAGAFIYAGMVKLKPDALAEFAESVNAFRILPRAVVPFAAHWIPWLEIVAALALVLPPFRVGGMCVLAALLVIYIAALASAYWRGLNVNCHCFGGDKLDADPMLSIARDLILFGLLLVTALPANSRKVPPNKPLVNS